MKINELELPSQLEADLKRGGRMLGEGEKSRLAALLKQIQDPLPELLDYNGVISENKLWEKEYAQYYCGSPHDSFIPGEVDPSLTLIIGGVEPDCPLALDYRTSPPRVVYLAVIDSEAYWIELSRDYASLVQLIQKGPV